MGHNLEDIGQALASLLKGGDVVFITGSMGSGKTTLIRYVLRFITKNPSLRVISPTFCLIQYYKSSNLLIYHCDLHRIEQDQHQSLHLEECIGDNKLVLIEWPEIIFDYITPTVTIRLSEKNVDICIDRGG